MRRRAKLPAPVKMIPGQLYLPVQPLSAANDRFGQQTGTAVIDSTVEGSGTAEVEAPRDTLTASVGTATSQSENSQGASLQPATCRPEATASICPTMVGQQENLADVEPVSGEPLLDAPVSVSPSMSQLANSQHASLPLAMDSPQTPAEQC